MIQETQFKTGHLPHGDGIRQARGRNEEFSTIRAVAQAKGVRRIDLFQGSIRTVGQIDCCNGKVSNLDGRFLSKFSQVGDAS